MRVLLFSAFFMIFAFVWMAFLAVLTMLLLLIMPYQKVHDMVPAPGFALLVRLVTLGDFRIEYHPDFNPARRSVFCFNHVNVLDAHTAAAAIPHEFCGLMDAWQAHVPFYGWLMRLSKGILVNRRKMSGVLDQMIEGAKRRREEGMSILVFPEGHRTRDGSVGRFKRGVFVMAREAGYPVVPVAVKGMYAVNRRKSYLFKPSPVTVYIGPQIEVKELNDKELDLVVNRVKKYIADRSEDELLKLKRRVA